MAFLKSYLTEKKTLLGDDYCFIAVISTILGSYDCSMKAIELYYNVEDKNEWLPSDPLFVNRPNKEIDFEYVTFTTESGQVKLNKWLINTEINSEIKLQLQNIKCSESLKKILNSMNCFGVVPPIYDFPFDEVINFFKLVIILKFDIFDVSVETVCDIMEKFYKYIRRHSNPDFETAQKNYKFDFTELGVSSSVESIHEEENIDSHCSRTTNCPINLSERILPPPPPPSPENSNIIDNCYNHDLSVDKGTLDVQHQNEKNTININNVAVDKGILDVQHQNKKITINININNVSVDTEFIFNINCN